MSSKITRVIDLGEAAALMATGFTLSSAENVPGKRYKVFMFETAYLTTSGGTFKIDDILDDYNAKKLLVNAVNFYNALNELKSMIHRLNQETQAK